MSSGFYQNISYVIFMLLLLVCSAFFSGAETAFFNLSRRQLLLLRKSGHKLQILTAQLLNEPGKLLSCLSFGNMLVNVLFYAIAGAFTLRIERQFGAIAAIICAFITFFTLIFFGEMLPKSIAYTNSKSLSITAAMPTFMCLRFFTPILFIFRFFMIEPILRLFLGADKTHKVISAKEFRLLIEQTKKRGLITADENKLLSEIVELGFLKVRHVMKSRVDMIACDITEPIQKIREIMLSNNLTKLPVYSQNKDNIIGMLWLRQLLLKPNSSPDKLIKPINFIPEQKKVESLLEFFRKTGTDTAIVVDEYGGIAGWVCLEDIAEELLGPIEANNETELIEQIGPLKYRLSGNLAIHDMAEDFGINIANARFATIGGLVTALLGKIPQKNDFAYLNNLKFTVERVQKRRIITLIITLEPISKKP
ncbi:MAG: HlyC/CorC family transporter [Planctomycetes bacterium]|nr:HlyC/CorC family transporter [Planctomycetota bacterium]